MTDSLCDLLVLAAHLAGALLFLLVGWRLGRESIARPMFDFPLVARLPGDAPDGADPWDEAVPAASSPPGSRPGRAA